MRSMTEPVLSEARIALTHLLLVDDDPALEAAIRSTLASAEFLPVRVGRHVVEALDRHPSSILVITDRDLPADAGGEASWLSRAAASGVPVLAVVADLPASADRLAGVDDWVTRRGLAEELPARLARLLARRGSAGPGEGPSRTGAGAEVGRRSGSAPPTDGRFFALVVHDLRTPLNVIGLSMRMITQAVPQGDPDLDEDLRFVDENFKQIERMLSQLGDYYRLFEDDGPAEPILFSPKRLVDELLESRLIRPGTKVGPVELRLDPTCPVEVALDPGRARQALQYALSNATTAANGGTIRLTLRGGPDRWVTEMSVDSPPPSSVHSTELSPILFERLCGSAAERRGMDLSIAAKVSEWFGGSARLVAEPGRATTVVLDWPTRLAHA